jgi:DNA-binding response OmpR family regulator
MQAWVDKVNARIENSGERYARNPLRHHLRRTNQDDIPAIFSAVIEALEEMKPNLQGDKYRAMDNNTRIATIHENNAVVCEYKGMTLHEDGTVIFNNSTCTVTPNSQGYAVLELLISAGGDAVSRSDLYDTIWPDNDDDDPATYGISAPGNNEQTKKKISNLMNRLNKELRQGGSKPIVLHRRGSTSYKLVI